MGMSNHYLQIAINLGAALAAGSLIGFERDYHGRPAGLRTHALVCLASSLLMTITVFQSDWLAGVPLETFRTDPTRMAQGIMTGIGFLGAGVIFMEGINVRGLTTAASIWITAALGILYGIGFFYPALLGTLAVLATLTVWRWIEARMPSQFYAQHIVRFANAKVPPESGAAQADRRARVFDRQHELPARGRGQGLRIPHDHPDHRPRQSGPPRRSTAPSQGRGRVPHFAERGLSLFRHARA